MNTNAREEERCDSPSPAAVNAQSSPPFRNVCYQAGKRLFDVLCASAGLLVLLPLGLVIALLIKISDGGAVFFRQTRIGQFGKPFQIWKFRSMVVNAEKLGVALTK